MLRSLTRWIGYVLIAMAVVVLALLVRLIVDPSTRGDSSFEVTSLSARYELLPQSDGSLDVRVSERIATRFLSPGKHGIIRTIPTTYQDHTNGVSDIEASGRLTTRGYGAPSSDTWRKLTPLVTREPGLVSVRLGDSRRTLSVGQQFFQISYTLEDVALWTPDRSAQEVYLDVNGTGWAVPVHRVDATLTVPQSLAGQLNGNAACYMGKEGSTERCPIVRAGDTFVSRASGLARNESVTFAVGFAPDTFPIAYTPHSSWNWQLIVWPGLAPAIALCVLLGVTLPRLWRQLQLRRPVLVTQYQPPKDVTPAAAAAAWGHPERGALAQLMDAAVGRTVHIVSDEPAGAETTGPPATGVAAWRRRARLRRTLRVRGIDSIEDADTKELLLTSFRYGLDPTSSDPAARAARQITVTEHSGLRSARGEPGGWFVGTFVMLLPVIFLCTFGTVAASPVHGVALAFASAALAVVLLVAALFSTDPLGPLTARGEEVYQHLRGLKNFMELSEAERISWLQGVESAPRVTQSDSASLIKLYEPLLPYAIIFGIEKSWAQLVGAQYRHVPNAGSWLPSLADLSVADFVSATRTEPAATYRARPLAEVNRRVGNGWSSFSRGASEFFRSSGSGGSGGGSGSSGSSWSSGGSGGGGRAGGGMGGGGGRSW